MSLVCAALILAGGVVDLAELLREGQVSYDTVIRASARAVLSLSLGGSVNGVVCAP